MVARKSLACVIQSASQHQDYGRWHDPQELVCWASATKPFLAAVVRRLVREQDLEWGTRISSLIGANVPDHITIESLVNHTSGLPRTPSKSRSDWPDPYRNWSDDRFDRFMSQELPALAGPAGTPSYSNVGYAVLTRAIEISQTTGWIELLRRLVIEPLGVAGEVATLCSSSDPRLGRARSLRNAPLDDWDVSIGPFSGSGGLCTTVPDMAAMLKAASTVDEYLWPRGDGPHAWHTSSTLAWHSGALLRSGSCIVLDLRDNGFAVSHSLGGLPGHGSRYAENELQRFASLNFDGAAG